jgi:hypothetical protein
VDLGLRQSHQTQLCEGSWDWVTQSQRWRGIGEEVWSGTRTIPDYLYLGTKPAFVGSNPWPWVNPSNGTVTILPAKACRTRIDADMHVEGKPQEVPIPCATGFSPSRGVERRSSAMA